MSPRFVNAFFPFSFFFYYLTCVWKSLDLLIPFYCTSFSNKNAYLHRFEYVVNRMFRSILFILPKLNMYLSKIILFLSWSLRDITYSYLVIVSFMNLEIRCMTCFVESRNERYEFDLIYWQNVILLSDIFSYYWGWAFLNYNKSELELF